MGVEVFLNFYLFFFNNAICCYAVFSLSWMQLDIMRPWQQVLESVDYIVATVTRRGLMSFEVGVQDTEFLLQTWGQFSQWVRKKGLQETGVTINSEALDRLEVIILLLQKLNTKLRVFTGNYPTNLFRMVWCSNVSHSCKEETIVAL